MTAVVTPQKVFDLAWQKFIVERAPPGADPSEGYRYQTKQGRRCAIGLAIPDGHPMLGEWGSVHKHFVKHRDLFDGLTLADRTALRYLQVELHDDLIHGHRWADPLKVREKIYRDVAAKHGLTVPGAAHGHSPHAEEKA